MQSDILKRIIYKLINLVDFIYIITAKEYHEKEVGRKD